MTNHLGDIQRSKCIIIIGANPAVNHPVGFRHFLKAKEKGAKLIVVDPRFTKSAAKADIYARIRPGTDIAFMYGMLKIIFDEGLEDTKYLDERVFGIDKIREEAAKWTAEEVENVTGISKELLIQITHEVAKNKPTTLIWAMGLTQHTVGTSNTRLAPIVQMVLGNIGKFGGGVNILRGHDNVQGASDMACLSENLPGYYPLNEATWRYYAKIWGVDYEWLLGNFVSKDWMYKTGLSLARWWAAALNGKDGNDKVDNAGTSLKALVVMGNGITSTAQQAKVKEGLEALELLVLADPFVNEAGIIAERKDGIYLLPAATQFETSGSVTATNRSGQWRFKIIDPLYESKEDQEILFELAKKLGFYEDFTKTLRDENGKIVWPENATREIASAVRSIGLNGWSPERLKKHTLNWDKFDEVTLEGKDEVAGEYYGLPWPCWSDKHPGSPVLYNTDIEVAKGGMGFRNNFGLEYEGENLLAKNAPINSPIDTGYPQITKDNIEKVLGITLSAQEKEKMGAIWSYDDSNIIATKCIEKGIVPYGNAKARAVVWTFKDQIPLHREPLHSPRNDLVQKYPSFEDQKALYRVDTKFVSVQKAKDYSKEFPLNLVTARLVNLNGAGMENRASMYLTRLTPEMFCEINPELASEQKIKAGDMIWVHSPEGTKIHVRVKFNPGVAKDMIFLPFHFTGVMQGVDLTHNFPKGTKPYASGESANTVTNYGYDIMCQIPETKGGLCRISKDGV
ncbi:formate dehydrogenase [Campylobacter coli]|nr:formate dehydrogenase [Campylobacter coli]EAJ5098007.1 formate dehydrogenase [Campylobacter coli]EAL2642946.1 formate dehydrogenase [Campylobacter coli]EHZ1961615.1 molybdopterin-dependent oxidoreductase [Campylobacter coli]